MVQMHSCTSTKTQARSRKENKKYCRSVQYFVYRTRFIDILINTKEKLNDSNFRISYFAFHKTVPTQRYLEPLWTSFCCKPKQYPHTPCKVAIIIILLLHHKLQKDILCSNFQVLTEEFF